jgi:small subunit ribosomal protein S2
MPYVNHRWLGGMLTNFTTVHKRLQRLRELEELDFSDVAGSGRTKKELLVLRREKDKLARTLGGIRDMAKVPSAVWIVDTNKEHLAVDEARKLGIPVVAILDTNCDPDVVDYAMPGNDDAIRAVTLLTRVIADAVAEGLLARHSGRTAAVEAEPLAEWERELLGGAEAADAAAGAAVEEAAPTEAAAPVEPAVEEAAPAETAAPEAAAVEPAVEEAAPAEAAAPEAAAVEPAELDEPADADEPAAEQTAADETK